MILQLNPPVELETTKGHGYANFLVDRGMDFDNEWIVFLDNGEIWSFLNKDVRVPKNLTYGRCTAALHEEEAKNYPDYKLIYCKECGYGCENHIPNVTKMVKE